MSYKFDLERKYNAHHNNADALFDLRFHPTKPNLLAAATIDGDVIFYDIEKEQNSKNDHIIARFNQLHKGNSVRRVRFGCPAADHLMISAAKTIKITDMNTCQTLRKIENGYRIYSLLVIDEYLIAIGDDEGQFKVWDYRCDRGVHMSLKECDGYIADLDVTSDKRHVMAASGEGTLTVFNVRSRKMVEPQSELFDAGFQSVSVLNAKKKVVCGAEDGALNIFNFEEYGAIYDRYPLRPSAVRGRGTCSIDCMEVIDDDEDAAVLVVGSSDRKLRLVSIHPNTTLSNICTFPSPIECLDVNRETNLIAASDDHIIRLIKYDAIQREVQHVPKKKRVKSQGISKKGGFFDDL